MANLDDPCTNLGVVMVVLLEHCTNLGCNERWCTCVLSKGCNVRVALSVSSSCHE